MPLPSRLTPPQPSPVPDPAVAERVAAMSTQDLVAYLAEQGLAEHASVFGTHKLTGIDLLDLTHADLVSIGITSLAERKRILRAVHRLWEDGSALA